MRSLGIGFSDFFEVRASLGIAEPLINRLTPTRRANGENDFDAHIGHHGSPPLGSLYGAGAYTRSPTCDALGSGVRHPCRGHRQRCRHGRGDRTKGNGEAQNRG